MTCRQSTEQLALTAAAKRRKRGLGPGGRSEKPCSRGGKDPSHVEKRGVNFLRQPDWGAGPRRWVRGYPGVSQGSFWMSCTLKGGVSKAEPLHSVGRLSNPSEG